MSILSKHPLTIRTPFDSPPCYECVKVQRDKWTLTFVTKHGFILLGTKLSKAEMKAKIIHHADVILLGNLHDS